LAFHFYLNDNFILSILKYFMQFCLSYGLAVLLIFAILRSNLNGFFDAKVSAGMETSNV